MLRKMKRAIVRAAVVVAAAAPAAVHAEDITNGVSLLTSGIGANFNAAAALGIAALAVGFGVYMVRKGVKLRA